MPVNKTQRGGGLSKGEFAAKRVWKVKTEALTPAHTEKKASGRPLLSL